MTPCLKLEIHFQKPSFWVSMLDFGGVCFEPPDGCSTLVYGKVGSFQWISTQFLYKLATKDSPLQATVEGRNPANQLRLVDYHIIYKVLFIPGGAGFCPSTVYPTSEFHI